MTNCHHRLLSQCKKSLTIIQGYRNFEIQIGPLDRWRHRRHTNMSSTIPNSHENSSFSSKSVSEIDYFSDRVQLQPVVSKRSKDNPKSLASDRCLLNIGVHQYPLWCLNPPIFSVSQRVSFYAPPPESGGVLCYTLRNFECPSVRPSVCLSVCPSVRLSVRPSVRPSAPTTILVSATPPTVLGQSFWNFTGVLRMVWRYAYCFFRILKLFFITFFPFLT